MSTGLTYAWLSDYDTAAVPISASPSWTFATYSEAYEFGEWQVRNMSNDVVVFWIWTSGPNDNGYWIKTGGSTVFVPID